MKHLWIVAHPDDEVFSSGGTMHKLSSKGDKIAVLYMTNRVRNHKPCHPKRNKDRVAIREVQKILNLEQPFGTNLDDEHLFGEKFLSAIDFVEKTLRSYKPDIVWTHAEKDFNQDHRAVSEAVEVATRRLKGLQGLIHFECPSATELCPRPFEPNLFVALRKEDVTAKRRAIMKYGHELSSSRGIHHANCYMHFRGIAVGAEFAEAFKIVREKA